MVYTDSLSRSRQRSGVNETIVTRARDLVPASGLIRLRNNRENYCPSDSTLLNRLSRRVPSVINHEIEEAAEREELLMPMVNRLRT